MFDLAFRKIESEQFHTRFISVGRSANDANEFIEIGQRNEVTFECFRAFLGFAQFEARPTQHDIAAVLYVGGVRFFE